MDLEVSEGQLATWLRKVWNSTASVDLVDLESQVFPAAARSTRFADKAAIAELRELTTTGRFIGDIVRSVGILALDLLDSRDRVVGSAVLHSSGHVSWERERFRNDLLVSRPVELWLLLDKRGVHGALTPLLPLVMEALRLEEGEEQLRPPIPDEAVERVMQARRAPAALWRQLASRSSEELAHLDEGEVDDLHARLVGSVPDPVERSRQLLAWAGSLTWPTEILSGEGPLAMRLLGRSSRESILAAMEGSVDGNVVMGGLSWASITGMDDGVGARLAVGITALLLPETGYGKNFS